MDDGQRPVRSLHPEPPIPDNLVLRRYFSAPFDTRPEVALDPFLQVVEIVVLPGGVESRVADDQMRDLSSEQRLRTEVVVEGAVGDFYPAALRIGPDALDCDHQEIVPDRA